MGSLRSLAVKELKELLRDPKILIGVILLPVVVFPLMGGAIQVSQESVQKAIEGAPLAVWTDDQGPLADSLLEYFYRLENVVPLTAGSLEEALSAFLESENPVLVYIPKGYNENITQGLQARIKVYTNLKNLNMAETQSADIATRLIQLYNNEFSLIRLRILLNTSGFPGSPQAYRNPIELQHLSILKGRVLEVPPANILGLVMSQSVMLPIMVMMMVVFAIQMAATSIALEKEQKTLEILMTLPVNRLTILAGKLVGSTVIALGGSIGYLVGFGYYMNSAFSFVPEAASMSLSDFQVGITPAGYLLLGVVIFTTLISALALALSVGAFADNVRSAQSLTSIMITPIIIPSIVLMFSDLEMLPPWFQLLLLAIPYTHSILAAKAAFLGSNLTVVRSVVFISLWTVVVLYLATKIFSTERVITARFTLGDLIRRLRPRTVFKPSNPKETP